jgi:hypothetical protein
VNSVAPDRLSLRIVFRDHRNARRIRLIDRSWAKCGGLILVVISGSGPMLPCTALLE